VSRKGSYAVRISGLADGNHDFLFELDKQFFASLEKPEIENGNVRANLLLEKEPGVLSLHFTIAGEVEVTCDRCLEPFMAKIEASHTIFVKMGDTPGEIEDNVVMIHKDDHEIEVGQLLYEFIVLALPIKRIHPSRGNGASACNPDMIRTLNAHSGKKVPEDQTDPRWDALKRIIGKNK
jgi:uncharacterized protein